MTKGSRDVSPRTRKRAERLSAARAGLMARLERPLHSEVLPATVELRPAENLRRRTRIALWLAGISFAVLLAYAWNEGALDRAEDEPIGEYLAYLIELAQSEWLLVPVLCLGAAGMFHWMHRRRPDWVRISVSKEEARVEGPGGVWVTPVREFIAVALRRRSRVVIDTYTNSTGLAGQLRPQSSWLRQETLWWVELVHPDVERSVPVWASTAGNAETMAKRVTRGYAHRLDLAVELPEQSAETA
jgi:hypothetical protein